VHKLLLLAACVSLAGGLSAQQMQLPKTQLKVGEMAPDFTVSAHANTSGKEIRLSDFRGKKNVILAFFPAAFTGG
jgi:peroxiredoxin